GAGGEGGDGRRWGGGRGGSPGGAGGGGAGGAATRCCLRSSISAAAAPSGSISGLDTSARRSRLSSTASFNSPATRGERGVTLLWSSATVPIGTRCASTYHRPQTGAVRAFASFPISSHGGSTRLGLPPM